jgi:hypothetical protein
MWVSHVGAWRTAMSVLEKEEQTKHLYEINDENEFSFFFLNVFFEK